MTTGLDERLGAEARTSNWSYKPCDPKPTDALSANEALFVDAWISMVRNPRWLALMLDENPDGALDLRIPKLGPPKNDGKALDFAD